MALLNLRNLSGFVRPFGMCSLKRATVYFDLSVHQALRMKLASTDLSVSDLVNTAARASAAEDADDLASFEARELELWLRFEDVLRDLKRRRKI